MVRQDSVLMPIPWDISMEWTTMALKDSLMDHLMVR